MAAPLANRPFLLEGSGDHAVLLVHGLGGGPHEVQRIAESLVRDHGLTARGIQLPGHGEPGPRMPSSTWRAWFTAIEREHADLSRRFARVDLLGFSTGCPLILHLAANAPVRGRLALLAPFVRVFQPRFLPFAPGALVRRLSFVTTVPRRAPPLRDPILRRDVAACSAYRTFDLDSTRSALDLIDRVLLEIDQVRAATLIVQGRRDTVVDPTGASTLYAGLSGKKRLVWLDDSDHLVALDADAARVLAEVGAFFAEDLAEG